MSDEISVGDVCVIVETAFPEKFRGMECVVTDALAWREDVCDPNGIDDPDWYYEIRLEGEIWYRYAKRDELRKKRPPAKDDSEPRTQFTPADPEGWDITHWNPDKVREEA